MKKILNILATIISMSTASTSMSLFSDNFPKVKLFYTTKCLI